MEVIVNRFLVVLTVAVLAVGTARADLIPVANPSFEEPHLVLGDAGVVNFLPATITTYTAEGWTVVGAGGTTQPVVGVAVNYIPDGTQVGWANNLISPDSYLYQDTGTASQAGVSYLLTVEVGSRLEGYPSNYLVEWLDGNTVIGSASGVPTAGAGNFQLVSVSGVGVGAGDLSIQLEDTGTYSQTLFDDVQLQSLNSPVPEPSSLALFAIGAVGVAGFRWRIDRRTGGRKSAS